MVCGLDPETSKNIINEVGRQVKSGKVFEINHRYSDIFADDVKCVFRPVHIGHYREYVCWSEWFYEGDEFPVWQCFWPDERGLFPWEAGCHPEVIQAQPQQFLSPTNVK